jgi:hypothetical protein
MYVIRRVWETKPREARRAASIVAEVGRIYEESGQRGAVKVYFNGGTLPGDKDRVYMEWTAEVIESPYRGDNDMPSTGPLGQQLRDITEGSWIEFYELLTPDKAIDLA